MGLRGRLLAAGWLGFGLLLTHSFPGPVRSDEATGHATPPVTRTTDGETPAPPAPAAPPDLMSLRAAVAQRMESLRQLAGTERTDSQRPASVAAAAELNLLQSLDLIYLQHQATQAQLVETQQERDGYRAEAAALQGTPLRPGQTFSWLLFDDCQDKLDAEASRTAARAMDVEQGQRALDLATSEAEQCERARRQILDELASAAADQRGAYEYRRRLADVECAVANATLDLRKTELSLKRLRREAADDHRTALAARVEQMRPHVVYTESELEQRKQALLRYAGELEQRKREAQRRLQEVDGWLADRASRRLAASSDSPSTRPDCSPETLSLVRRLCHEQVLEMDRWVVDFQAAPEVATQRFRMVNNRLSVDEIRELRDHFRQMLEILTGEEQRLNMRVAELLQDLATLHRDARLRTAGDANATPSEDLQVRTRYLEDLLQTLEFAQRHVLALRRSLGRFAKDAEARLPSEGQGSVLAQIGGLAGAIWNYELVAVGDQSITIGKISRGLGGFSLGLLLSAVVSRLLGRRLLPRLGLDYGASEALRTLCFYSLSVVFGILALEMAHVPLTAFTFLGGAVAIGVGFGSQNVLNNFISGLILLAERPLRVGDLVEVDSVHGTVEHIGARSTIVRTGANVEIIVPNSRLLENNLTNLTRTDNRIRTSVTVGVAYGSPLDVVKRELLAAVQQPDVLADPVPFVIFTDFADSALTFEVYFWVHVRSMTECARIAGAVREAIDERFREVGIEIPFPQQQLHLSPAAQLEIQLQRRPPLRIRHAA
ncbi:MAG: mechanosensitive ion channel [Pirellulales bacterium]